MVFDYNKKIIFSGTQPSGCLTLGNYIGAISNWKKLQKECNCLFSVVDLHALTIRQDPQELKKRSIEFLALYLACGIEPEDNIIFLQSHVSTHCELTWILNCFTYMGELGRMTQYKDKVSHHQDNINTGLLTYPVLMASDILLYQTDLVPVGQDQKQHLELCRDIAIRFNNLYGDVFKVPDPYIPEVGARVMSLQEPSKKMSKSDINPNNYIALLDTPDMIRRKVKRAVTDSDNSIFYREDKEGICNLLTIYSCLANEKIQFTEERFKRKGYGELKSEVAEIIIDTLNPIRDKYNYLIENMDYVENIYAEGANKAYELSTLTLEKVKSKLGLILRKNRFGG